MEMSKKYIITTLELSELIGIKNKDIMANIRNDIKKLKITKVEKYFSKSYYIDKKNEKRPTLLLSLNGVKLYIDNRRKTTLLKPLVEWYNKNTGDKQQIILSNRKEIEFLDSLEQALKPFYIKGIRQCQVLSYRIDYYIPKLKIAIEYDENNHANYTYEQQELRQANIEKELGCKFIRISDKNTDSYNIGQVIKEIYNSIFIKAS